MRNTAIAMARCLDASQGLCPISPFATFDRISSDGLLAWTRNDCWVTIMALAAQIDRGIRVS
jgi:hypothetical protein